MANVFDVAKYFLYLDDMKEESDGISNLKLQKLVYYAQGFFGAVTGAKLFADDICAWTHGPVVPALYQEYKSFGKDKIEPCKSFDPMAVLNDDERDIIADVFSSCGIYSAWALRDMTHSEPPWKKYQWSKGVMPFQEMVDYFATRLN